MQTAEKIANLLLSDEQANKDLAFALVDGQGVDFEFVLAKLKPKIYVLYVNGADGSQFEINILNQNLRVYKGTPHNKRPKAYKGTYFTGSAFVSEVKFACLSLGGEYYGQGRSGIFTAIDFFIDKLREAYHETKQSNHYNQ